MQKLTVEDLKKIKEKRSDEIRLREGGPYKYRITVHMGTCGIAAGARNILSALMDNIEKKGTKEVLVATSGCAGLCSREPMMTVEIQGSAPVKYGDLTGDKVNKIFEEHILGGRSIKEYLIGKGHETVG